MPLGRSPECQAPGEEQHPQAVRGLRRFPAADDEAKAGRFKEHVHLAALDRADVLVALHETSGAPGALALLGEATDLLACVLRDVPTMRALLSHLRPGDFLFHRAAVVALGLLGTVVTAEEGIADPSDELDVQAYILASSLAGLNEGHLAADTAYRHAAFDGARAVADTALACLEVGDFLGVIG